MKTSKGSHSTAESQASALGLRKTSGYRSPEENKRVGGHKNSDHLKGNASDFAGSPAKMKAYAEWAAQSGLFKHVIYGGRDLITGRKDNAHDDHVHVSWG